MPPIVRIADPRGSTPRPLSLVGVSIAGVVAGLLLVQLSLAAARPDAGGSPGQASERDEAAPTGVGAAPDTPGAPADGDDADEWPEFGSNSFPDTPAASPTDDEPSDGAGAEGGEAPADSPTGPDGAAAGAAQDAPEPGSAVDDSLPGAESTPPTDTVAADTPGGAGGAALTLTQGRVAYFQCPNDRCRRDHGLEREVFRALERASGCLGTPGEGDVRVVLGGGAVTDVRFRDRGGEGIDIGALSRCLSPPLRRLNGSDLPDGVVVSFRFDLR